VKRSHILLAAISATALGVLSQACSGDNNNETDSGTDASTQPDVNKQDVATTDVSTKDVINDVTDGGSCPTSWTVFPDAGAATAALTPDGGFPANVILHAAGSGTQDYTCEAQAGDAGTTYAWVFVGPEANLDDCNQTLVGHHFASEAGAAAPEWQTLDNSFVIAKKLAAFTDDAGSVPWLLLQETSNGGTGTIAKTLYVQRLYTSGGIAPMTGCDQNSVNTTQKVAYTADYYFYGP